MTDDDIEQQARDDLKAALLELGRQLLSVDPVPYWKLENGYPLRIDAGIWGQVELQRVDLAAETVAEVEHHEAREKHLDDIEAGGPLVRWPGQ